MGPKEVFGSNKCQTLGNRIYRLNYMEINLIRIDKEYQAHFMEIKSITIEISGIDRDLPSLEISITRLITYMEVLSSLIT